MNYEKAYSDLIYKRLKNPYPAELGERHHIEPTCIGGSNDESNFVQLSCKEHLFAHHLLCKIYSSKTKIHQAFHAMCFMRGNGARPRIKQSVKQIATAREFARLNASSKIGRKNARYIFTKYKFVNRTTNEIVEMTPFSFTEFSELSRQEVNNLVLYGHYYSKNWGLVLEDGSFSFNKKRPTPACTKIKVTCEFCGKEIVKANYARWHGTKCKLAIPSQ